MALEFAFQDLVDKLACIRMTLEEFLLWAVTEGKPSQEDHVLVTKYDDATNDLIGWTAEAEAAAKEGLQMVVGQINLSKARLALITCQERFNQVSERFFSELLSPEVMDSLNCLAREGKWGWRQWVNGVRDALNQCRHPLYDVNQALFQCWQELSDRANLISVSMKQQINLVRESTGESDAST